MEPLFACVMLPILSIALANVAFLDYYSVEDIFAIPVLIQSTLYQLRIREAMLEVPLFQTFANSWGNERGDG